MDYLKLLDQVQQYISLNYAILNWLVRRRTKM